MTDSQYRKQCVSEVHFSLLSSNYLEITNCFHFDRTRCSEPRLRGLGAERGCTGWAGQGARQRRGEIQEGEGVREASLGALLYYGRTVIPSHDSLQCNFRCSLSLSLLLRGFLGSVISEKDEGDVEEKGLAEAKRSQVAH